MTPAAPDTATDFAPYLAPARYVDSDHHAVIDFARSHATQAMTARDIAVKLYYAVRDEFRYDPYSLDTSEHGLKASTVVQRARGFCISKAVLLAAAARVLGVPARLGYADVRNHLTSPKLHEMMGTDLFVYHGYTEMWIDSRWVKATPAFNQTLCEKAGIHPLEFDGRSDSIFHEFDASGRRHMEYVNERGHFADLPRDAMLAAFRSHYPTFPRWGPQSTSGDFESDVERAARRA
ncbi:MAG: transglutaminase family protein [Burkholderiaceae bacterium]